MVPLRVFPNEFGLGVAKYLLDHCGATGREVRVGASAFWVVDPPATSICPRWTPMRVVRSRFNLLVAKHLLDECRYGVRGQMEGPRGVIYVVPEGYPARELVIAD
jgi:hypothetical protein